MLLRIFPPVLIKPENKKHNGAVHKNIKIINNQFNDITGYMITKYYSGHIDCPVLLKYIN